MKAKSLLIMILALGLVVTGGAAFAQMGGFGFGGRGMMGGGYGGMMGGGYGGMIGNGHGGAMEYGYGNSYGYSQEAPALQNELRAKESELNQVLNAPKIDAERTRQLMAEINSLQDRLAQNRRPNDYRSGYGPDNYRGPGYY